MLSLAEKIIQKFERDGTLDQGDIAILIEELVASWSRADCFEGALKKRRSSGTPEPPLGPHPLLQPAGDAAP